MNQAAPLCCSSAAFKLLAGQIPSMTSAKALLHGAVAISRHQLDGVSIRPTERRI